MCTYTYIYIYMYTYTQTHIIAAVGRLEPPDLVQTIITNSTYSLRPFFILRIVRPRIVESKFRNHCAKKLDGALRLSTSFV